MGDYLTNLEAFKDLIECYTIADLRSMICDVADTPSGGCCYPAVQTLFSLTEMLGRLLRHDVSGEEAFVYAFTRIGTQYADENLASKLYKYFRHGIAHNSLAKAGVKVKKSGDRNFHLSENGHNIDIRVLFEDFVPFFNELFDNTLRDSQYISQYEQNLRDIFEELRIPWEQQYQVGEGDLDVSVEYTRTYTTPSGTRLPCILNSGASETQLSTGESRTQLSHKNENKNQKPHKTWWQPKQSEGGDENA